MKKITIIGLIAVILLSGGIGFFLGKPAVVNLTGFERQSIVSQEQTNCNEKIANSETKCKADLRATNKSLTDCTNRNNRIWKEVEHAETRLKQCLVDVNKTVTITNNLVVDLNKTIQQKC